MTEPGIGSDLASMSTRAIRDGDRYVVDGAKTFITNGINADLVITAVKTDPAQRHRGISLLVVERGTPGFERGRNLEKLGLHAQDTAELHFHEAAVPVANRLGEEGAGFGYLVANLAQERLSIAISAVATAAGALDWTLDYVKEREAFGQPVGAFQHSRFALAEAKTEIDLGQVFVDRCTELLGGAALGGGRGRGEVVVHGDAGPRHRRLPAAARRLRVHDRVPHRAGLRRRARDAHLRRDDRDHEGDRRALARLLTAARSCHLRACDAGIALARPSERFSVPTDGSTAGVDVCAWPSLARSWRSSTSPTGSPAST